MSSIEIFIIFSVRTFDFTVMSGSVGTNELVLNATLFEASLKQRGRRVFGVSEPFGELGSVIRLHTFDLERKPLNQMFKEQRRTVCAVFFKRL